LPVFFLLLNTLSIRLALRYFGEPPYLAAGKLTDHFRTTFRISERESEIISLLTEGHTSQEIADCLFISLKTVENHVYSIYQKTEVRNRVQLLNLVQSNRAS